MVPNGGLPTHHDAAARGAFGEAAALRILHEQGYAVLERNWRYHPYEIDIIARDQQTYVFVEVKVRKNSQFGAPEEAVTAGKLARIAEAGQRYLDQIGQSSADWRIDIVAIEMARGTIQATRLIQGAWTF